MVRSLVILNSSTGLMKGQRVICKIWSLNQYTSNKSEFRYFHHLPPLPHCRESTILSTPAVAHDARLLYTSECPTGILSICDR